MAVGEPTERIAELEAVDSPDPDQRAELASLLSEAADRAGERADISAEDEYIERLATLTERYSDPAIRVEYARALAGATDVIDRDSEFEERRSDERFREYQDRLAGLHADSPEDDELTEQYARGLAQMVAIDGDGQRFDATAQHLEELRALYDGGEAVATQLARGLAQEGHEHAVARENDDGGARGKGQQVLAEIEELYERYATDAIAAELAHALRNVSITYGEDDNEVSREETIDRLASCYEDHPTDDVADHYVWALAIAAGNDGRNGDIAAMHRRLDRTEELFESHTVGDVAASLAQAYAQVADVYFQTERNHPEGESYLDELEALYERFPADAASRYSLKLALAVRIYVEDDYPATAEDKLDELDALYADHPEDDDVEENLGDALYELIEYYVDEGDIESARKIADHPVARERGPDHLDSEHDSFQVFALFASLYDADKEGVQESQMRPAGHVPRVETSVVTLLLTGAVFGLYAAVDPSLSLFSPLLQSPPIGQLMGGVLTVVTIVGLTVVAGISRHIPPVALFLPLGPAGLVVQASHTPKRNGSDGISQTMPAIALVGAGLSGSFVLDPVVGQYLFYGVVCWTLVTAAFVPLLIRLVESETFSPSVTVVTTTETLEKLELRPMEAEHLLYRAYTDDEWER